MSNLSSFFGGTSGEVKLTATGTITAGDLVSLLSDGTAIKSTSPEFNSPTQILATNNNHIAVCHVPGTQKYVVAYSPVSTQVGTAVVVDYATGSAVVGTPVVFSSNAANYMSCVYYAAQNVVVIAYHDMVATDVEVIAASISGTALTFGSSLTIHGSSAVRPTLSVYDSTNQAVVVAFDTSTTPFATVIKATGTTLSWPGGPNTLPSSDLISTVFDAASGKIIFSTGTIAGMGTVTKDINLTVGTVSGTSLSLGTTFTPTQLNNRRLRNVRLAYSSEEGKTYAFGIISDNTSTASERNGFIARVDISGTNVSLSKVSKLPGVQLYEWTDEFIGGEAVAYSSKENAFYALGGSQVFTSDSYIASFYKIKVDGEAFTVEQLPFTPQITAGGQNEWRFSFNTDVDGSNFVVVGSDFSVVDLSITRRSLAESTSLNWVGIAKNSVTNGQTVTVVVPGGIASGLSSLTPGNDYYASGASYAKAGYQKIGKALSATSMLITG